MLRLQQTGRSTKEIKVLDTSKHYESETSLYITLFYPGYSGNWVTWFVSQHSSFTNFHRIVISREVTDSDTGQREWVDADYQIPDTQKITYRTFDHGQTFPSDRINAHELWLKLSREQLLSQTRQAAPNKNFSKSCYTLHPHHSLSGNDHTLADQIVQDYQVSGVIYPAVFSTNRDIINGRLAALKSSILKSKLDPNRPTPDQYADGCVADIQPGGRLGRLHTATRFHILDLGKILAKDDAEYQRLVEFISEPPLENWKELVDLCVSEVYNGWWHGKTLTTLEPDRNKKRIVY